MTVGTRGHTRRVCRRAPQGPRRHQDQALTRSGHRRLTDPLGELGGFPVLVTTEHALGTAVVTVQLDGAPGTDMRMTPAEVAAAEPSRLIIRMEGRLTGLEALKAKTLAEVHRLTGEADRARDDLAKPFTQADKLAVARDRVQQIDDQLSKAAAPPRPDSEPPAETSLQPTRPRPGPHPGQGHAPGVTRHS
jgi:cell pole-organizing protein PopZ